ncbi:hypothetical protein DFH06DRAFT_1180349 [Mycena polygramma]|nr:hypothetical protein DFH06DRAFT_1180349 [Mycena polygramma]
MMPSVGLLIVFIFALLLSNDPSTYVQARSVSRPQRSTISRRDNDPFWIWAADSNGSTSTSPGTAAFVKHFESPAGKNASSAVVALTALTNFTLFVNGQPIGNSVGSTDGWKTGQVFRAALNTSVNTFSILVVNGQAANTLPPGLLVAIEVSYTDATNTTLVTDATWLASRNIPDDFPTWVDVSGLPQFVPAVVAGPYGMQPWGNPVSFANPVPLSLDNSTWIWSAPNASRNAEVGIVGFRKTVPSPAGKRAVSANILLTADNTFSLLVNGIHIGAPPGVTAAQWRYAQQFTNVSLNSTSNVFTVIAENLQGSVTANNPAGFIAAIEVLYADATVDNIRTDETWLSSKPGSSSIFLATPDGQLSPAVAQGPFGIAPWRNLSGVSDVLNAAAVPTAPFNSSASASASHRLPLGTIVAITVGGLGALLVLVLLIHLVWRTRTGDREAQHQKVVPASQYSASVLTLVPTIHQFNPETRLEPLRASKSAGGPPSLSHAPPSYDESELRRSVSTSKAPSSPWLIRS